MPRPERATDSSEPIGSSPSLFSTAAAPPCLRASVRDLETVSRTPPAEGRRCHSPHESLKTLSSYVPTRERSPNPAAPSARRARAAVGLRSVRPRPPSLKVMPHEFERRLLAAAAFREPAPASSAQASLRGSHLDRCAAPTWHPPAAHPIQANPACAHGSRKRHRCAVSTAHRQLIEARRQRGASRTCH